MFAVCYFLLKVIFVELSQLFLSFSSQIDSKVLQLTISYIDKKSEKSIDTFKYDKKGGGLKIAVTYEFNL